MSSGCQGAAELGWDRVPAPLPLPCSAQGQRMPGSLEQFLGSVARVPSAGRSAT